MNTHGKIVSSRFLHLMVSSFLFLFTSHRTIDVCVWFDMWNECFPGILEKIWRTQVQHISFFFPASVDVRCISMGGDEKEGEEGRNDLWNMTSWGPCTYATSIYTRINLLFYKERHMDKLNRLFWFFYYVRLLQIQVESYKRMIRFWISGLTDCSYLIGDNNIIITSFIDKYFTFYRCLKYCRSK